MSRITRREFLRMGAGAAVILGTPPVLTNCQSDKTITGSTDYNASVAIIPGNDLDSMTREAVEAIGGMSKRTVHRP